MKHHVIVPVLSFLLLFTSCQKVIELELAESDKKYVVEGIITNEPGTCKVLLSKTRFFYEDNQFEMLSAAVVKVSDNGQEFILSETSPGTYENNAVNGTPGHQYLVTVQVENQVFTASCTMPGPVMLDTLYVSPGPLGQFKFATVGYWDPASTKNYYRFIQYLNGVKDPAIFWENGGFSDGQYILRQLDTGVDRRDDPGNIETGDSVRVEMQGISEEMFRYWYSLRSGGGQGSGNIAAPSNPITNIKGGALGYFSAHTVNRRTVIAP